MATSQWDARKKVADKTLEDLHQRVEARALDPYPYLYPFHRFLGILDLVQVHRIAVLLEVIEILTFAKIAVEDLEGGTLFRFLHHCI